MDNSPFAKPVNDILPSLDTVPERTFRASAIIRIDVAPTISDVLENDASPFAAMTTPVNNAPTLAKPTRSSSGFDANVPSNNTAEERIFIASAIAIIPSPAVIIFADPDLIFARLLAASVSATINPIMEVIPAIIFPGSETADDKFTTDDDKVLMALAIITIPTPAVTILPICFPFTFDTRSISRFVITYDAANRTQTAARPPSNCSDDN